jgi:broad specificity phosphatase PhoE
MPGKTKGSGRTATPVLGQEDSPASGALLFPRTILLVRHAEKATEPRSTDPSLSEAGVARARELARHLEHAGLTHVFTSEFRRTRETAAPLALRTGLAPTVAPAKDLESLRSALASLPRHSSALVVGHSNTVPVLVRALAESALGSRSIELSEADYDRLFVVMQWGERQARMLELRY